MRHSFARQVLKTSRPADCDGERLVDFLQKALSRGEDQQSVGDEPHAIHQHFGLTSSALDILNAKFPESQTIRFKSSFNDTPSFGLAHHNLWLSHEQGGWTLKYPRQQLRLHTAAWWSTSHHKRSLYDELVEEKVLPGLRMHYSKDLTHVRCDPFGGSTRGLFAGEDVQLLRSIDMSPNDKEAITTYRDGAAEAEMEWLPFLRMVSALFLQGVEQGVYEPATTVDG